MKIKIVHNLQNFTEIMDLKTLLFLDKLMPPLLNE
jgi:hypothetical protein